MNRILISGATGFIGQALLTELLTIQNLEIIVGLRQLSLNMSDKVTQYLVGNISDATNWAESLKGVDVIIHMAGRAHIEQEDSGKISINEFRKVNTEGTLTLAEHAIKAGVKRLIFISSIGVNGNQNSIPFLEKQNVDPQEPYAISKFEAEEGLRLLAVSSEMDVVVIRPPLVYGPNAPGNFGKLVKWINKGIPLPFGAIHNQRSLVALDNLISFIIHCIDHPKAANEIFLISDGADVSTSELLQKVAKAFGNKAYLLPIPVSWMQFVAKLLGKEDVANRLFGSLQIDSSKARELLGWKPVITMDEQLKKTAEDF